MFQDGKDAKLLFNLKNAFTEAGGFDALLYILQNAGKHAETTVYAALYAVGEWISNSEPNKAYLGEKVGYLAFSSLIKSTNLELDRPLLEMIVESATFGSFRSFHTFNRITHSNSVSAIIKNIQEARPSYLTPLPCSRAHINSVTLSSLSLSLKEMRAPKEGGGGKEEIKEGGVEEKEEEEEEENATSHQSFSDEEEDPEEEKGVEEEDVFSSSLFPAFPKVKEFVSPSFHPSLSIKEEYKILTKLEIRSPEAALMILDVLLCASISTQQEIFSLLLKLLHYNLLNAHLFSLAMGIKFLVNLSYQIDERLESSYFRFIAALGLYDISLPDAKLLFDLGGMGKGEGRDKKEEKIKEEEKQEGAEEAKRDEGESLSPPPSPSQIPTSPRWKDKSYTFLSPSQLEGKEKELQLQTLFIIGSLAERKDPSSYFHFNGVDDFLVLSKRQSWILEELNLILFKILFLDK